MAGAATFSSGIAGRYASALFELAKDEKKIPALEKDLASLSEALSQSDALRDMIDSPIYSRADQTNAVTAIAGKMGLSASLANTLGLMAQKRRLFVLPQLIEAVQARIEKEKGIVAAEITSAKALTKAQQDKLSAALKDKFGKDIRLEMNVDETLLGGMIVKVGSKMIDTSMRSKLANIHNAMKEVG